MRQTSLIFFWFLVFAGLVSWTFFGFPPFSPLRDALGLLVPLVRFFLLILLLGVAALACIFARTLACFAIILPVSLVFLVTCTKIDAWLKQFGNVMIFVEAEANAAANASCIHWPALPDGCVVAERNYGDGTYIVFRSDSDETKLRLKINGELRPIGAHFFALFNRDVVLYGFPGPPPRF